LVIEKNADGSYRVERFYTRPGETKPGQAMVSTVYQNVEVSGDTISFFSETESGRTGFDLALDGDKLMGVSYSTFTHPYEVNAFEYEFTEDPSDSVFGGYDMETTSGKPDGYDAEEVWSCELVRVSQ
jgi:hypothetical protein